MVKIARIKDYPQHFKIRLTAACYNPKNNEPVCVCKKVQIFLINDVLTYQCYSNAIKRVGFVIKYH